MKTLAEIWTLLDEVQYKNWWMQFGNDQGTPWFQWHFDGVCARTGGPVVIQSGRKHRLSVYMTDGEIIQAAFAAALQAEEHECREFFKFKGKAIFGPHIRLGALLERADDIEGRE